MAPTVFSVADAFRWIPSDDDQDDLLMSCSHASSTSLHVEHPRCSTITPPVYIQYLLELHELLGCSNQPILVSAKSNILAARMLQPTDLWRVSAERSSR
jgi:hypothetical protein